MTVFSGQASSTNDEEFFFYLSSVSIGTRITVLADYRDFGLYFSPDTLVSLEVGAFYTTESSTGGVSGPETFHSYEIEGGSLIPKNIYNVSAAGIRGTRDFFFVDTLEGRVSSLFAGTAYTQQYTITTVEMGSGTLTLPAFGGQPEVAVTATFLPNIVIKVTARKYDLGGGELGSGRFIVTTDWPLTDARAQLWGDNWFDGQSDIFTPEADSVDFNALTDDQKNAAQLLADDSTLHSALDGSDYVKLPSSSNLNFVPGLLWISQNPFLGGAGNDTIVGQDLNDIVRGEQDDDEIWGGLGSDTLFGDEGRDKIAGEEGNDTIVGGAGNDSLNGGSGNDKIWGGSNEKIDVGGVLPDIINGGIGNDVLVADGINGAELHGGDDDDLIIGHYGNDIIFGDDGADIILAGRGIDIIDGGADDDIIFGGGNTFGAVTSFGIPLIEYFDFNYSTGGDNSIHGGSGTDTVLYQSNINNHSVTLEDGLFYATAAWSGSTALHAITISPKVSGIGVFKDTIYSDVERLKFGAKEFDSQFLAETAFANWGLTQIETVLGYLGFIPFPAAQSVSKVGEWIVPILKVGVDAYQAGNGSFDCDTAKTIFVEGSVAAMDKAIDWALGKGIKYGLKKFQPLSSNPNDPDFAWLDQVPGLDDDSDWINLDQTIKALIGEKGSEFLENTLKSFVKSQVLGTLVNDLKTDVRTFLGSVWDTQVAPTYCAPDETIVVPADANSSPLLGKITDALGGPLTAAIASARASLPLQVQVKNDIPDVANASLVAAAVSDAFNEAMLPFAGPGTIRVAVLSSDMAGAAPIVLSDRLDMVQLASDLPMAVNLLGGDDSVYFLRGGRASVDGGRGNDTAVYGDDRDSFAIAKIGGAISVRHESSPADFGDELRNFERVQFDDGSLVYNLAGSDPALIYRLYQAAFARTPDEGGLRYWASAADQFTLSQLQLATEFRTSPEFISKYGANVTNRDYTYNMYKNVLGREPDQGGIDYWTNVVNIGWVSRDQLLIEFAQSQENVALTAPNTNAGYWVV